MESLSKFFSWWGSQLFSLLPRKISRFLINLTPRLVIYIDDDLAGLSLTRVERTQIKKLGHFSLDSGSLENLGRLAERDGKGTVVHLRVPLNWLVHKDLILPYAAANHLKAAIGYEMDRETPFTPDMVYWSAHIRARNSARQELTVRLSLVQKRRIEGILGALNQVGLLPTALDAEGMIEDEVIDLADRQIKAGSFPKSALACAAMLIAAIVIPFIQQSRAISIQDERISALKPTSAEVASLRQKLGVSERAATRVAGAPLLNDPLMLLAALTDTLPNDAYLTDISIRQQRLELSGKSSAPARLIGLLSGGNDFKNPRFSAPVVHLADSDLESFSIQTTVLH